MESTTMRLIIVITGLWMITGVAAFAGDGGSPASKAIGLENQKEAQPATGTNCAIDLASIADDSATGAQAASQTDHDSNVQDKPADTTDTIESVDSEEPGKSKAIPRKNKAGQSLTKSIAWYRSPYVVLLGIVALLLGISSAIKKYVPTARPVRAEMMQVLGRTPISAKQSAVLLHVGKRILLLGVTGDSIRTLTEITDPEEMAVLMGKASSTAEPGDGGFDKALAREFGKYDDVIPAESDDDTLHRTKGQLQSLLGRLRDLQSN